MAVNYSQGFSPTLGSLYTNLMSALKYKGEGENRRKREAIEDEGLFGTGLKRGHIQDLTDTAMGFAKFGAGRRELKKSSARRSFKERMSQARERIHELRRFGDDDSINEIRFIQAGMAEERHKFENLMMDYDEKSLWDTGFGGKGVGYKDTGGLSTLAERYMKRKKTGGGDDFDRWGNRADAFAGDERSYEYEGKPYSGKFGLPGDSRFGEYSMRDFPEPSQEDYQPDTYGDLIESNSDYWEDIGKRRRNYIGDDGGPIGQGRRLNAQSPSYPSQALEKLGPDRPRGPLRRSAQGGMQRPSQLQEKYGLGAYRANGFLDRDPPYEHTFADQYLDYRNWKPSWGRGR